MKHVQRVGVYARVMAEDQVLLTRIAANSWPAGHWNLPGGRLEHGEDPKEALQRELYEETGIELSQCESSCLSILTVHTVHDVGSGPKNDEDFYGISIVYDLALPSRLPVEVTEIDGTTDSAAWFDRGGVQELQVLPVVSHVVDLPAS